MFELLRTRLFFLKMDKLIQYGLMVGLIKPFDKDLYERLSHIYFAGLPVSIRIKYLRPTTPPMQCYDRSLLISLGLHNSILASGNRKDIELECGKGHGGHRWVEHDGWVYDPTTLYKYKKELYYKIYEPINIYYSKPEECAEKGWYQNVLDTTLEDYKINGEKRFDLLLTIPFVKEIADLSNNEEFKIELNDYLNLVEYDSIDFLDYIQDTIKDLRKII